MQKTVFSLQETQKDAERRAYTRLSKAFVRRFTRRLENVARECGFEFCEYFRLTGDDLEIDPDVDVIDDITSINGQLSNFFDIVAPIWRQKRRSTQLTLIGKMEAENAVALAFSHASRHRSRVSDRARFYSLKFPKNRSITGRDAEDLTNFVATAAGPLDYAGPTTVHDVDELISRVYIDAPWLADPINTIWRDVRSVVRDEGFFRVPPTLLVGPPGTGKSSIARSISELAGVHHVEIDVGAGSSAMRIAGVESGWSSRQVGEVFRAVIDSRSPNPVMIINEIDKTGKGMISTSGSRSSLSDALLPLLERSTAKHFRCPATTMTLDLSDVSWFLTANNIEEIDPVLLSRMRVIHVRRLTIDDVMTYIETHHTDLDARTIFDLRMAIIRGWSRAVTLRHIDRIIDGIRSNDELDRRH